jgi:hypothetical protein
MGSVPRQPGAPLGGRGLGPCPGRRGGRCAAKAGDILVDGTCLFAWEAADVDDLGRFERPDEGLYPRVDRRQEARPAHQLNRFGLGMLASQRNPAGQPGKPDKNHQHRYTGGKGSRESRVIPEIEFEAKHS